ncbi:MULTISPECIES: hypothetical protein [Flavobacterium]|uniref:hypothetical protein n=1 Tax=Flavobacterium TaxID=237 RepID=UPI001FCAF19B|nr:MULTISPECIES: hypothetical protein [Flavobacterium]UOK42864.1 hypothetical protein LZF87_01775 [Flavobacterium enshiense]
MKKYVLLLGAVGAVLIAFAFTTNIKQNDQEDKMTICHYPHANQTKVNEITISKKGWPTHQAHGDYEKIPGYPCACIIVQDPE